MDSVCFYLNTKIKSLLYFEQHHNTEGVFKVVLRREMFKRILFRVISLLRLTKQGPKHVKNITKK